jgi:NAD(P)-dependent dehydrogenase (short-subunit alcohol dehydrogenase family)
MAGRAGLVPGAAAGIGRATAHALVAAGADVLIADIAEDGGQETVALTEGAGTASFVPADVSDADSVQQLVDSATERFGKLDFAHNNAGMAISGTLLADIGDDEWSRVISVDLTSVFYCMRAEIQAMLRNDCGGSIVNTASSLGQSHGFLRGRKAWRRRPLPSGGHRVLLERHSRQRDLPRRRRHEALSRCGGHQPGTTADGRSRPPDRRRFHLAVAPESAAAGDGEAIPRPVPSPVTPEASPPTDELAEPGGGAIDRLLLAGDPGGPS